MRVCDTVGDGEGDVGDEERSVPKEFRLPVTGEGMESEVGGLGLREEVTTRELVLLVLCAAVNFESGCI